MCEEKEPRKGTRHTIKVQQTHRGREWWHTRVCQARGGSVHVPCWVPSAGCRCPSPAPLRSHTHASCGGRRTAGCVTAAWKNITRAFSTTVSWNEYWAIIQLYVAEMREMDTEVINHPKGKAGCVMYEKATHTILFWYEWWIYRLTYILLRSWKFIHLPICSSDVLFPLFFLFIHSL